MAQINVWPSLGTTVTMDDLVTVVGADGAVLTYTAEARNKLDRAVLLDYDPRPSPSDEVDSPTSQIEVGADITTTDLIGRRGAYSGQPVIASGYATGVTRHRGRPYRWNPASTATQNGGTIVGSYDVGRWELMFSGRVDATAFGARNDGTTDDTAAIQAAIDYAIANQYRVVYLPAGPGYKISSTLHLSKNATYTAVNLLGDGYNYNGTSLFGGTKILATSFSNQPALNVNGARGSAVIGVDFYGACRDYISTNKLGHFTDNLVADVAGSAWEVAGLHANAYARYTPYAAVAVDGWSGSTPSPTSYPTTTRAYGQLFSSDVTFYDCMFDGFAVGAAIQPCNDDGNGDFVKFINCYVKHCKYGYSIGNTQARNTLFFNPIFSNTWRLFTTSAHGLQNGKIGSTIFNAAAYEINGIFEFGNSSGIYGPVKFQNLYAESLYTLGEVGTGSASTTVETTIEFDQPQLAFNSQTEARGIPARIVTGGDTNINYRFSGGVIEDFPSVALLDMDSVIVDGTLIRPTLRDTPNTNKDYLTIFHNATCGGAIFDSLRTRASNRIKFRQFTLGGASDAVTGELAENGFAKTSRNLLIPAWIQTASTSSPTTSSGYRDALPVPRSSTALAKSSFSSVTLTQSASDRGLLTLVWTSLSDSTAALNGHEPGDAIYDDQTGMVFVIRSRTTTTVLAEAQNNYKLSSGVYTTVSAFSTTVGNLYFLNCRLYTPTFPVIADTVLKGSATFNPGSLADGAGETTTVTVTGAAAGDMVEAVSFTLDLQSIMATAWVSAADTVSVRFQNETGGVLDLASGTLTVRVRPRDGTGTFLRNVGRDDTASSFLDTDIVALDRVYVDQYADRWMSSTNSQIVTVDGTAKTLEMAGVLARPLERKRIPWFVRQPPANSATR